MTQAPTTNPIVIWKNRLEAYWHDTLWHSETRGMTWLQVVLVRFLRVIYIVLHGFREQNVNLLSAALTFTTLMSLVPLLALSLSVLKGLGTGDTLIQQANAYMADMPQQFQEFTARILDLVTSTNFAQLGGIGGLVLMTMVIQLLARIETAFNQIWGVQEERSWGRKITNYISVIVVVPILMVAAITVTAKYKFGDTLETLGLMRTVPFLFTWAAFSFLYQAMPHVRVKFNASVLGGLAGALLWQAWLRVYIWVQPGVTNYNVIYGTLASVPIFLAWLFISWQIVLAGALVSQAIQNEALFVAQRRQTPTSLRMHLTTAWTLLFHAGQALRGEESTLSLKALAKRYGIANAFLKKVATNLVALDYLAPTGDFDDAFLLKRHPDQVVLAEVSQALLSQEPGTRRREKIPLNPIVEALNEALDQAFDQSKLDTTLSDLLREESVQPRPHLIQQGGG